MVDNFNELESKLNILPSVVRKQQMEKINTNLVYQLIPSQEKEVQFEKVMTLVLTLYFQKKNITDSLDYDS